MRPNSAAERSVLLTLADVARRLRVSRATVYVWAADGTLPVIRLGPRPLLRVQPEALEAG
jgi:excisionase family DNA binding protein